jgi:hypothetical protein
LLSDGLSSAARTGLGKGAHEHRAVIRAVERRLERGCIGRRLETAAAQVKRKERCRRYNFEVAVEIAVAVMVLVGSIQV